MKNFEEFISGATKPPASQIKEEYDAAVADCEHVGQSLARYLRVKDGKPVYSSGVEAVESEVTRSAERLDRVQADINEYLTLIGEFDSVQAMVEKLARLRRTNDNLTHDVNALLKQASNKKGTARPQDEPLVMSAMDKKYRVAVESREEIEDLSKRIAKAKELVGRY